MNLVKDVLKYSIDKDLSHIPSALSMLNYITILFDNTDSPSIIDSEWNIVIGKPFGAQAYYVVWNKFNDIDIDNMSYILDKDEVDFVDYSEVTIGNALGVAAGISIGNNKKTWCNISDGSLQIGATLEAIQFIGFNNLDILLTVDYNGQQLTGSLEETLGMDIDSLKDYFINFGWSVYIIGSNDLDLNKEYLSNIMDGPSVVLIDTIKGDGVIEMENDPVGWHYKKLGSMNEITLK